MTTADILRAAAAAREARLAEVASTPNPIISHDVIANAIVDVLLDKVHQGKKEHLREQMFAVVKKRIDSLAAEALRDHWELKP